MSVNRKEFIRLAGMGMGGILLSPTRGAAASATRALADQVAMLYDSTVCIGCRACQRACKEWNNNPIEPGPSGLPYDAPLELSADTWTIIQLYRGSGESSFVKRQCMHCLEPACASACLVGALSRTAEGSVVYDSNKCMGCRYCMMACPFRVPKFEWDSALPLIRKCTFCADRQAQGMEPACTDACPTGAVVFGKRDALITEAHRRIEDHPDRYVNHVYGEHEAGGTSGLYLSHVSFDRLAFPVLGTESATHRSEAAMFATPGVIAGAVTLLSAIRWYTGRRERPEMKPPDVARKGE
jgi:formate dehydrogenase iron-sulfur subunit